VTGLTPAKNVLRDRRRDGRDETNFGQQADYRLYRLYRFYCRDGQLRVAGATRLGEEAAPMKRLQAESERVSTKPAKV
jgi:hypothetical protein